MNCSKPPLAILLLLVFLVPTGNAMSQAAPAGHPSAGRLVAPPAGDALVKEQGQACSEHVGQAPASGCSGVTPGSGQLTYHGGPVMHDVQTYAIYWLPPGYSFDNASTDPGSRNPSSARFVSIINGYLSGIGRSSLYNLLQQYNDSTGPPGTTEFGGYWSDSAPFPGGRGSMANPLLDNDVVGELLKGMSANGWSANGGNNEFFIFTPYNVYEEGLDFCAWHSWWTVNTTNIIFSYIMDAGNRVPTKTCSVPNVSTPHNDTFADYTVNVLSHEQLESAVDPLINGWYHNDYDHEMADECRGVFGPAGPDGRDVTVNGTGYLLQEEWSNAAGRCYLPPPSFDFRVSYVAPGSAADVPPPLFSYTSAGLSFSTDMSSTPQDVFLDSGSAWSAPRLIYSFPTERWETPQQTYGSANATTTVVFQYYQQFLTTYSFTVTGSLGQAMPPSFTYTTFGREVSAAAKAGSNVAVWDDANSTFDYARTLTGSNGSVRWVSTGTHGTIDTASFISPTYQQQFFVTVGGTPREGGAVSGVGGWQDYGANVSIAATSSPGWKFLGWVGAGRGSYSGPQGFSQATAFGIVNETASFEPGLTIAAGVGTDVAVQVGSTSYSVAEGSNKTIYVPKGTSVTLVGAPTSYLYSFSGFSGGHPSAGPQATLTVLSPMSVSATSSPNYPGMGLLGGAAAALMAILGYFLKKKGKTTA